MMKNENEMKVFLVDDDAVFLKSLEIEFLLQSDCVVETYSTGELCLKQISNCPDVVVLDYHLNGSVWNAMDGIQTLDKIKEINPDIHVVMLSSQDKIEVAVDCMHHKAFDYVVKSETAFMHLRKIIGNIAALKKIQNELKWYMDRA